MTRSLGPGRARRLRDVTGGGRVPFHEIAAQVSQPPGHQRAPSASQTWRFFSVNFRSVHEPGVMGVSGPGTIGFYRGVGVVSVLSPEPRSEPVERTFPLDRVRRVVQNGTRVSFAIGAAGGRAETTVRLDGYADDVATEIARRLSTFDQTPEPVPESIQTQAAEKMALEQAHHGFIDRLYRLMPFPFVTNGLVAVNVIVFSAMLIAGAGIFGPNPEVHIAWGANFGPATASGQWWRLVTSTFIHFGIVHIVFNMWALYVAGRLVERMFGHRAFLLIYLFAGVTGSIASLIWKPDVLSAGASGAVFGVFGALLAYMLRQPHSIPSNVLAQLRGSTIAFVGYSLIFGFIAPGIDNAAHLGGLAGGFVQGFMLARPLDLVARHEGALGQLAVGGVVGAAILAAMLVLVP